MTVEFQKKERAPARGLGAALREKAAAAYCGDFAGQTFRVLRHQGRGPVFYKVAGKVFYKIEDLDSWLASCRVEPAAARGRARKRK